MNIGIAGAGVMGRLLAFALSHEGHEVSIFDQGNENTCSMAAAGMLAPVSELEKADLALYEMGMLGIQHYWPSILEKLSDVYFEQSGTIVLAHPRDKSELIRFMKIIDAKSPTKHQPLSPAQFKELEPELIKFANVYYFPEEAHIDNQTLLEQLRHYLCKNKVEWNQLIVTEIAPYKIQNRTFDLVFDCRGMGAKSMFQDLLGIRGELLWLRAPEVKINRPIRFLHPRYSIYITPRPHDVYIIGASEIHSEDYSGITVKTTLELLTAAYALHPRFAEAEIIKTVTQCRPALTDYNPKIKYTDGLIAVNGLYRHGYLLSPSLVTEIMCFLQHGFSALRFPQFWEKLNDANSIK